MEELIKVINVIGDIGGSVAVFCFAWALFKFKDMDKRLQKTENKQVELENSISKKMSKIDNDVSYIRGWIEGTHSREIDP